MSQEEIVVSYRVATWTRRIAASAIDAGVFVALWLGISFISLITVPPSGIIPVREPLQQLAAFGCLTGSAFVALCVGRIGLRSHGERWVKLHLVDRDGLIPSRELTNRMLALRAAVYTVCVLYIVTIVVFGCLLFEEGTFMSSKRKLIRLTTVLAVIVVAPALSWGYLMSWRIRRAAGLHLVQQISTQHRGFEVLQRGSGHE